MNGLTRIGSVKARHARNITRSRLGLGMEKLDRGLFDPAAVYDKVAECGVKWIRIQSGWARTEQERGRYDFDWLDDIVDNLLARGLIPWLCLCYGNELYDADADNRTGAIGRPPVRSREARDAWQRYVAATAAHFKGRIRHYEVWNEPDGGWCWKHGPDPAEYGIFVRDTAQAVKGTDAEAKLIGGSFCWGHPLYLNRAMRAGMGESIDYVSFHNYQTDAEGDTLQLVEAIRGVVQSYNPRIGIIQGETGCQSSPRGRGALAGKDWTEEKQAKMLARRVLTDLIAGVTFTSWFSAVDMYENLSGYASERDADNYGYYGILREEFDGNAPTGRYAPKLSYRTLQTLCALLSDDVETAALPIRFQSDSKTGACPTASALPYRVYSQGFRKAGGGAAFVYWKSTDILTMEYHGQVTVQISGIKGDVRLVDLVNGDVYSIEPERFDDSIRLWNDNVFLSISEEDNANYGERVIRLPLTDAPLMLIFGDFMEI